MSNPHYEAATSERFAGDWRFTEAVLAVAWEQRTANLIAIHNARFESDGETETFIGERIDTYELAKTIISRLGLGLGKDT